MVDIVSDLQQSVGGIRKETENASPPEYSALPDSIPGVTCTIISIVVAAIVIAKRSKRPNLDAIPTVGPSSWLKSWWASYKFQTNAMEIIQEGYEKYKSAPFKVADPYGWIVILGGRQHIEELRKAPDDALSPHGAANDILQKKYTMGPELLGNLYHVEIIRSRLTRNLVGLYPEIRDEVSVAFDETLDLRNSEWKSVHALSAILKVVSRTSNRLFVGLPLCRDPDWVNITVRYARDLLVGAYVTRHFPSFLAPFVARFTTHTVETTRRAMKHLTPIIEGRLKLQKEYGKDWPGKPNDLLSWLLDEAPEGPERTTRLWTIRVLAANFAAIHTTSNSFYHVLFFLAESPQYIQPLREEVESIIEKEGWSKASLGKMRKIDSFLRESQRLAGIGNVGLPRKAVKDFTFSDGTFVPKGTLIMVPSRCLHLNNAHYDDAHVFSPFRFSDMHDEEGKDTKYQFVSTSTEYLPFGHGKYACPGRFLAASELKSMLAHVVVSYDIKLEDNTTRPKEWCSGLSVLADPTAKIMFRRRTR